MREVTSDLANYMVKLEVSLGCTSAMSKSRLTSRCDQVKLPPKGTSARPTRLGFKEDYTLMNHEVWKRLSLSLRSCRPASSLRSVEATALAVTSMTEALQRLRHDSCRGTLLGLQNYPKVRKRGKMVK